MKKLLFLLLISNSVFGQQFDFITRYGLIKTGNIFDSSANKTALDSKLSVTITSPVVDNIIRYNGTTWVNGVDANTSAGAGINLFYSNTPSGVSTYETISTTPDAGSEQDESTVVNNNTVQFEAYNTVALNRTTLDAGLWIFNIYTYASITTGTSTLTFDIYKRASGGTETLLFSVTTPAITDASVGLVTVSSVQPAYTILATDLLLVKVSATTTNVVNTTVHFVHSGTVHYSTISTPLITTHNGLAGLQGGTTNEFYHLTNAEYTGTGSGAFVKTTTPIIATPSLTTGFTIGGTAPTGNFIVGNGTNYISSTSTIPTSAGATANKVLLSNGTNYVLSTPTFPNASATSGKTIRSDGTNWIASTSTLSDAPSTNLKWLHSDGTNWITSSSTLAEGAVTSGKILTSDATNWIASSYILSGTSAQTYTFPTTTATIARTDAAQTFTGTQTFSPTTTTSGLNMGAFAGNPSIPVNGDIWYNSSTAKIVAYQNNSTVNLVGAGSGDALVANPLSQFASTTSSQFIGVISDETGTGKVVAATAPSMSSITLAAGTASAGTAPLYFTSGSAILLTSPVGGAEEVDANGIKYYTKESTAGRGYVPDVQKFTLTSNGSTISTIANFFGSTSNPTLVSGAEYLIEIDCYYTNTTSGTVTWTFTNSAAPTSQNIWYHASAAAGIVAPAGSAAATYLDGNIQGDATAAKALTTSATLTNATTQWAHFSIHLFNSTGTSLKIQATKLVGGTITPLVGSYWTCTRIPTGNIGIFVN